MKYSCVQATFWWQSTGPSRNRTHFYHLSLTMRQKESMQPGSVSTQFTRAELFLVGSHRLCPRLPLLVSPWIVSRGSCCSPMGQGCCSVQFQRSGAPETPDSGSCLILSSSEPVHDFYIELAVVVSSWNYPFQYEKWEVHITHTHTHTHMHTRTTEATWIQQHHHHQHHHRHHQHHLV